jgi:hypothetical protein
LPAILFAWRFHVQFCVQFEKFQRLLHISVDGASAQIPGVPNSESFLPRAFRSWQGIVFTLRFHLIPFAVFQNRYVQEEKEGEKGKSFSLSVFQLSSHSQTSRLLTSSLSLGVPVPRPTQCVRDA